MSAARANRSFPTTGSGGSRGWTYFFGLVSILAGVLALIHPGAALLAIALLFAAWLVVGGVFRMVEAFAIPGERVWLRALTVLLAVISIIVGIVLFAHPVLSLLATILVLGIYWIAHGIVELAMGITDSRGRERAWNIGGGMLGIAAGLILLLFPFSAIGLAFALGFWLIVFGGVQIGQAVHVGSAGRLAGA